MINKEVSKNPDLVADLFTFIRFLEEAVKYSREPYEKYKEIIDLGLFSSLDKDTLKPGFTSWFIDWYSSSIFIFYSNDDQLAAEGFWILAIENISFIASIWRIHIWKS